MLREVLGVERRRRSSDEEKLEIMLEVGIGGASVTQVAQLSIDTQSGPPIGVQKGTPWQDGSRPEAA